MRKTVGAGLLALSLGACTPSTITIDQVQNATISICNFLPTATTIANILANGNSAIDTAAAVAQAICAAVKAYPPAAARRGAAPPIVNGVLVEGRFVR